MLVVSTVLGETGLHIFKKKAVNHVKERKLNRTPQSLMQYYTGDYF